MNEPQSSVGYEIGIYVCPKTQSKLTLTQPVPLALLEWPVTVERCTSCKQKHVLEYGDVRHEPAFGYE